MSKQRNFLAALCCVGLWAAVGLYQTEGKAQNRPKPSMNYLDKDPRYQGHVQEWKNLQRQTLGKVTVPMRHAAPQANQRHVASQEGRVYLLGNQRLTHQQYMALKKEHRLKKMRELRMQRENRKPASSSAQFKTMAQEQFKRKHPKDVYTPQYWRMQGNHK